MMKGRKRRIDLGPQNQDKRTQIWRAVSTQPNRGDEEGSNEDMSLEENFVQHSVPMEVGRSLMRFIQRKGTQEEIERETGAKISLPSSKTDDFILIEANSAESVSKASEKIKAVIDKAVNSYNLPYSHFVTLPLAIHPGLVDKLVDFQNKILEMAAASEEDSGIEKSIFIKPKAFHLTILVLKLWNEERVKAAEEVLRSVSSKVMDALENKPVSIGLKGLNIMKGYLSKAQVVYVPVEEIGDEGRLLRACEVIIGAFVEAGLVLEKDAQHKLNLHASVMNARHRRWQKGSKKLRLFNARGVFEMYGSEEWGEYPIREAHLSQRFVYDENGFYQCCASIPFPDDEMLVS